MHPQKTNKTSITTLSKRDIISGDKQKAASQKPYNKTKTNGGFPTLIRVHAKTHIHTHT